MVWNTIMVPARSPIPAAIFLNRTGGEKMNDREREAYLNRIGYEGELRTDKKCLEKIMDLHLCSIPFENL